MSWRMSPCILFVSYFIGQKDDSPEARMWSIILKGLVQAPLVRKGTWKKKYLLIFLWLLKRREKKSVILFQIQASRVPSGDHFSENENLLLYQKLLKIIHKFVGKLSFAWKNTNAVTVLLFCHVLSYSVHIYKHMRTLCTFSLIKKKVCKVEFPKIKEDNCMQSDGI